MEMSGFILVRQPRVFFGPGALRELPALVLAFGGPMLLVTGSGSLHRSGRLDPVLDAVRSVSVECHHCTVAGEPSPGFVDQAVSRYADAGIRVVVAIGGGSALDAGKAVSAMLPKREPVETYIEGQPGFRIHDGVKVPFIAVPTTSGTGSEATNNAVLSKVGRGGYKRSLRHPAFVPDIALVDPELTTGMPRSLTVSSGMDACTQLLEAWVSPFASPYTDAIARSGLEQFVRSFMTVCVSGTDDIRARSGVAYAALMSGIALANAGLGIVHGFASSIGGYVDIPHGTLCATLLASATRENIRQLRNEGEQGGSFLGKYAEAGRIFRDDPSLGIQEGCDALVEILETWQEKLEVPRLGDYGITEKDLGTIADMTRSKSNPVALGEESLKTILRERL
jgi:alcohol dehydrogenase class IV